MTATTTPAPVAVTYAGRILAIREDNGYSDSDFLALVMTDAGEFKWVMFGTTRFAWHEACERDATPAVVAAYMAWRETLVVAADAAAAARSAATLHKGNRVRVAKGRKVPVGTIGYVVWFGVDQYGSRYGTTKYRVGIEKPNGERVFTAASNCMIILADGTEVEPVNAVTYAGASGLTAEELTLQKFPPVR